MRAPLYPRFGKIEHQELTAYFPDVDAKDFQVLTTISFSTFASEFLVYRPY
jgi:hypothetical protein